MKKAVIDIGSNTINLVIGEIHNGTLNILFENKQHAKLAKGGINNKRMTPEALQRGFDAIAQNVAICNEYNINPDKISAYATATIRSTENGEAFVQEVKEKYGVTIETITGDKEAEFIYEGVVHGFDVKDQNILILDIGGGSNEFIHANREGIIWKHSFNLGVSRMLDRFNPTEPITQVEIDTIKAHFKEELSLLFENVKPAEVDALVGSSGSFDTIRNMILTEKGLTNNTAVTSMPFESADVAQLMNKLIPSTLEERLAMPGMIALRADYMVVAALFIQVVLEEMQIKKVFQCNYALKEGALFV